MIVVLHGFGSNGTASATCNVLRNAFPDETVITPTYDSSDPEQAHKDITQAIPNIANEEIMFVGISLGGFWARYFANQYSGSSLVMLNPSLAPYENLMTRLGSNTSYASGEDFYVTEENVKRYHHYAIVTDRVDIPIYIVMASNDDQIPYQPTYDKYFKRADMTVTSDGGHRLQGQEDLVINTVSRALNTYQ